MSGSAKRVRFDDSSKVVDGDRSNEMVPDQAILDAAEINEGKRFTVFIN